MILITDDFFKNVPKDAKHIVMKKLEYFKQNIMEVKHKIRNVPKGFWIRRINDTDIFKFRLNNGDRVLFTFMDKRENNTSEIESNNDILLLDYCKHDKQIIRGRGLDIKASKKKAVNFSIDKKKSNENENLDSENKFVKSYISNESLNLNEITSFVVEDRYLAVLLDKNNKDYLYYLSDEQYECLKINGKPIIIAGAAGSGKTTIAVHKLFWCSKNKLRGAYFTYTDLLCDNTMRTYNKFKEKINNDKQQFFSINKFYSKYLKLDAEKIVRYSSFNNWLSKNKYKYKKVSKVDNFDIWTEIRGIIKGYMGLEYAEKVDLLKKENRMLY